MVEYGRENEVHVTICYGLPGNEVPEALRKIAATIRPFPVFLEKVSIFDTNPDYDVVKIDIDSPWLQDLNERIRAAIPHESKFKEYRPHVTIAYVRKGTADKLAGIDPFATKEVKPQFIAHEMEFKGACEQDDDPNRTVEVIRFSTQKEPQVKEAFDPDVVDPKQYAHATPVEYAVQIVGPKGEDWGYLTQQGDRHLNASWMGLRSLQNLQKYKYGNKHGSLLKPGLKVKILTRPRLKEALDPDAVDPKEYAHKIPLEYAVRVLHPDGTDSDLYLSQQGSGFKACWMTQRSLDILKRNLAPYLKVRILTRPRLKEAADPDAVGGDPLYLGGELVYFTPFHADRYHGSEWIKNAIRESDPDDVNPRMFVQQLPTYYVIKAGWKSLPSLPVYYFDRNGKISEKPARMAYADAAAVLLKLVGFNRRWQFNLEILPAEDQTQMSWQGRRYPQDFFRESIDPDAPPPAPFKNVAVHYLIKGTAFWWNKDWGWRADRGKATWYSSPDEAAQVIKDIGLFVMSAQVVPVIEESSIDPDAPSKQVFKQVAVTYYIRVPKVPGRPFNQWWNEDSGWQQYFGYATPYVTKEAAEDAMFAELGMAAETFAEVVPIIKESKTPDPFGHLDFPTDASQIISYLRKKRHRRPAIL